LLASIKYLQNRKRVKNFVVRSPNISASNSLLTASYNFKQQAFYGYLMQLATVKLAYWS